jgi:hypothetical protein
LPAPARREPVPQFIRPTGMKTRIVSLFVIGVLLLAACGGAVAPTTTAPSEGLLDMCAEGVTDCVDVVIEPGTDSGSGTDESIAVPTGNAVNPQPVTEAALDAASADETELRFKLWMGVEPCDVIDRVEVTETVDSVDVQIFRGVGDIAATCVAMAVEKTVVVNLDAPLGDRAVTLGGVPIGA